MSDSESRPPRKVILTAGVPFSSFERAVRSDARKSDVWDLFDGTASDFRKDEEKTRAATQKALGILEDHLDDENASLIAHCKTAKEAFKILKHHHIGSDSGGQFMAIHHLMTLKLDPNDDRTAIISKSNNAMQKVKALVTPQLAIKVEDDKKSGDGGMALAKSFDELLNQLQLSAILNALIQDERTSASATSLLVQKDLTLASVHNALRTMDSVAKLSGESALKSSTSRFKPRNTSSSSNPSPAEQRKFCSLHDSSSHSLSDCKVVQSLIKDYKSKRSNLGSKSHKAKQAQADSDSEEEVDQAMFTRAALKSSS